MFHKMLLPMLVIAATCSPVPALSSVSSVISGSTQKIIRKNAADNAQKRLYSEELKKEFEDDIPEPYSSKTPSTYRITVQDLVVTLVVVLPKGQSFSDIDLEGVKAGICQSTSDFQKFGTRIIVRYHLPVFGKKRSVTPGAEVGSVTTSKEICAG